MRVHHLRRIASAISVFAAVALAMLAAWPASIAVAAGCSPFGNPPQTLISDPVPNCFGGTPLGPWNDSDGTPRYACLYKPASATMTNRLPMLVWIHPSLVTADSITSTNILSFQNSFTLPASTTGFVVLPP